MSTSEQNDEDGCGSSVTTVMYTGGSIRPMAGGSVAKVGAIGFHDGRVSAVGSEAKVASRMKSLNVDYKKVALSDGKTLLPGFIDPHVHIIYSVLVLGWNDFSPFEGQKLRKDYNMKWFTDKVSAVKHDLQCSGDLERGAWIMARGVAPSLMVFNANTVPSNGLIKLPSFSPDFIDEIEREVPVFMLSASAHTGYVNTPALKAMYAANEIIQAKFLTFEEYRTHVNSLGGIQEVVLQIPLIKEAIPKHQFKVDLEGLDQFLQCANKQGLTMLYDAFTVNNHIKIMNGYFSKRPTRIRIGYARACESLQAAVKLPPYVPTVTEFKNVYQGSVKLVSDGSNQGLTGYQYEPFHCEPADNVGAFNFPPFSQPDEMTPDSEFTVIMKTILDKGWPLMVHANGDKAIDLVLDAYRHALDGESGIVKRHRIEHCSFLNTNSLQRLADLGISPSFLIGHVGYWGYAFRSAIFKEKAKQKLDLCRSAVDKGMRISLHTDSPVCPLGPLCVMEQAVTRIMEGDSHSSVLNGKERLTVEQALKALTIDAAWQCHSDHWVGSLEEGKMADYVILGEDPITRADPVGMRDIPVLETWVGGMCVYARKSDDSY